jgi:E3 ubiquitin-protein ligase MARCH6
MLEKRAPEEEKGVPFWKKAEEEPLLNDMPVDGRYFRVPATEHTLVLDGQPEYIETDADGVALNELDRTLVELQIAAARKFGRDPAADYKVIFYPSHFKLRLAAFFTCLWSASAAVVWVAGVLPIRIGRLALARLFRLRDVHDAYSWLVGLYTIWAIQMARYIVSRERRRWKKYLSTRRRRRFPIKLFFHHTTGMFARLIVAAISIFGILPLLLGLVFEVYLVIPLKYTLRPCVPVTIRFWDCWAAGMLWGSILVQAQRYAPPNGISRTFDTVSNPPEYVVDNIDTSPKKLKRDGWFRIRLRQLVHEFILPLCAGLLSLIILPFFLQWAIFTPLTGNDSFMCKYTLSLDFLA